MSLSINDLVRELPFLYVRDREYPVQIDLRVRIKLHLVESEKDLASHGPSRDTTHHTDLPFNNWQHVVNFKVWFGNIFNIILSNII